MPGHEVSGPAIIEHPATTLVVSTGRIVCSVEHGICCITSMREDDDRRSGPLRLLSQLFFCAFPMHRPIPC